MFPTNTCARCGREIETGEFIAVIGQAPPDGMSTPIGRAEKIFEDVGVTYCRDCLPKVVEERSGAGSPS